MPGTPPFWMPPRVSFFPYHNPQKGPGAKAPGPLFSRIDTLPLQQALLVVLAEQVHDVAAKGDIDLGAVAQVLLLAGQVDGGQNVDVQKSSQSSISHQLII